MTDILESYADLSSSTSRFQVSLVLQSVIEAPPNAFDKSSRAILIKLLLKDLKALGSKYSRLMNKDASTALLAVKILGRTAVGSEPLTEPFSLSALLELSSSLSKEDKIASSEALKCVANTLLLYAQARATFVSKEVGGGTVCAAMLEKATTPDLIFTLGRIMFLATASPSALILSLVEDKRHGRTIIDVLAMKMDMMMASLLADKTLARDALSELLKFTFNILHHYPELCRLISKTPKDEFQFSKPNLDGLLPPLLRIYQSLPPTFPAPMLPPLTHVIHALVTIPITPSLPSIWFSLTRSARNRASSLHHSQPPTASVSRNPSTVSLPRNLSNPPRARTLDRVLAAGRRTLSIYSNSPASMLGISYHDVVLRTLDLLEIVFTYHFPSTSNPDSREIREAFKRGLSTSGMSSDTTLDDLVSPLVVLCTRICMMDPPSCIRVREWIVPPSLDRSYPLDERDDFLGRCMRLLRSVYYTRLKASIGEMLYAACDCDPSILSSLFGYGNVAGFLFNKGIMSAPPPPSSDPYSSNRAINPITGTYNINPQSDIVEEEMTEEEKEAEMDKLFVLFDRLDRAGAPPANQRKFITK